MKTETITVIIPCFNEYLETKHRPIFILKDSSEEETRTHYEYEH